MYTIIYFSPTGNAKHLAIKMAAHLGIAKEEILALEFIDFNKLKRNDHLILLYPVHGFNAARTVKRFAKNIPAGIFQKISLIGVGCTDNWMNDAASTDLKKHLQKRNYPIIIDEKLAMPLTFIMNFPDELNLKLIAEAEKKVEEICQNIREELVTTKKIEAKSHVLNFLGKGESGAARLFGLELYANKNCNSCGICWENCPEKNIKSNKQEKPKFGFHCLMCMRCIYNCPQNAISPRISKFIPIKNGYSLSKYIVK